MSLALALLLTSDGNAAHGWPGWAALLAYASAVATLRWWSGADPAAYAAWRELHAVLLTVLAIYIPGAWAIYKQVSTWPCPTHSTCRLNSPKGHPVPAAG